MKFPNLLQHKLFAIIAICIAGIFAIGVSVVFGSVPGISEHVKKQLGLTRNFSYRTPPKLFPLHHEPKLSDLPTNVDDLFIVAHYDDETLACAGLLESEVLNKKNVLVVVVSFSQDQQWDQVHWYGIRHHFTKQQWSESSKMIITPSIVESFAVSREQETVAALNSMHVDSRHRIFLRYPDLSLTHLTLHPHDAVIGNYNDPQKKSVERYEGAMLEKSLADIIVRANPKRIITHDVTDSHPDHRAIGSLVASIVAASKVPSIPIWYFLVHWNNKEASWVPPQYSDESSWVKQKPLDTFVVPDGSPKDRIQHQDTTTIHWPSDFVTWKRDVIEKYTIPLSTDKSYFLLYAKKNELYWENATHTLHTFNFVNP